MVMGATSDPPLWKINILPKRLLASQVALPARPLKKRQRICIHLSVENFYSKGNAHPQGTAKARTWRGHPYPSPPQQPLTPLTGFV
jgi:hypothetical protein